MQMLEILLDSTSIDLGDFFARTLSHYQGIKHRFRAQIRDLVGLMDLGAVTLHGAHIQVNMEWPQQFSQSELLERYENMPSAVSANHPAMAELLRLLGRRS